MARFTAGFAWLVDGLAEAGFGDGEAQRGARWRERGKGERLERERETDANVAHLESRMNH